MTAVGCATCAHQPWSRQRCAQGSSGQRLATERWSDGTIGEALRHFGDEALVVPKAIWSELQRSRSAPCPSAETAIGCAYKAHRGRRTGHMPLTSAIGETPPQTGARPRKQPLAPDPLRLAD